MILLNQEEMRRRLQIATLLEANPVDDANDVNSDMLTNLLGLAQFSGAERLSISVLFF